MATLHENRLLFNSNVTVSHSSGNLSSDFSLILVKEFIDKFKFNRILRKNIQIQDDRLYHFQVPLLIGKKKISKPLWTNSFDTLQEVYSSLLFLSFKKILQLDSLKLSNHNNVTCISYLSICISFSCSSTPSLVTPACKRAAAV